MTFHLISLLIIVSTGLLTGASLFISIAVQPAWLKIDTDSAIDCFRPVYYKTSTMQTILTCIAIVCSIVMAIISQHYWWLLGAFILSLNIPFSYYIMMPLSQILLHKFEFSFLEGRDLIKRWGVYNWVRTVISTIALIFFVLIALMTNQISI